MEYFVVSAKDKEESDFLSRLFIKMRITPAKLSQEAMEDRAFLRALKEADRSGKGNLKKAALHLKKIISE